MKLARKYIHGLAQTANIAKLKSENSLVFTVASTSDDNLADEPVYVYVWLMADEVVEVTERAQEKELKYVKFVEKIHTICLECLETLTITI